jgi:antitoxin VapB
MSTSVCTIWSEVIIMPIKSEAKLFKNGRSQAVRLPREFRFEGHRVRIKKTKSGILLEPIISDANSHAPSAANSSHELPAG